MATTKKPPAKKAPAKKSAPSKTTAPAKKAPRARADATTLLAKDHKDVKALFKRYEKLTKAEADGSERQELAEQICQMLTVHATIEEEIFYPAVREADVDEDLLDEAEVEHASAKDLIGQIQSMSPEDDLYDAKVTCSASTSTTTSKRKKARCSRRRVAQRSTWSASPNS
jgi:DUF438 domain-containing protein